MGFCDRIMGDNDIERQQSRLNNGANAQPTRLLTRTEKRDIHLKLYQAALDGDWDIAKDIYEKHQGEIKYNAEISWRKDTALHIAAAAGNHRFVEQLLKKMSCKDLDLENDQNKTAFFLATASGKPSVARAMMKKKKDLAMTRDKQGRLPIHTACLMGHWEMVVYFYIDRLERNQLDYNNDDKKDLITSLIDGGFYVIARIMLKETKELAFERYRNNETLLHLLAHKSFESANNTPLKQTGLCSKIIHLFSKQAVAKRYFQHSWHEDYLYLVQYVWDEVLVKDDAFISEFIRSPSRLIFTAAEKGNAEFLTILLRSYPDLIFEVDENSYSIFHIAVLHRHEDIFKLIHKIGSIKEVITKYQDREGNNMLHLAARIPSRKSLQVVPGAALQLQREMLWLEEVMKVVQPQQREELNNAGLTPDDLFMKDHEELMKAGEKWMKGTANSCMVVATLIATVVFAAGFTVPGGNNQENGIPIFLREKAFKAFAVTNALSLISSVTSVLTFLSIMTSRYAIGDFYWSLPNKLVIGLVTLFISIVAMLVAFIAALFLAFDHGNRLRLYVIPIAAIASVPVFVFIHQHFLLFMDIVNSTYRRKSIFRPSKSPFFTARIRNKKNN